MDNNVRDLIQYTGLDRTRGRGLRVCMFVFLCLCVRVRETWDFEYCRTEKDCNVRTPKPHTDREEREQVTCIGQSRRS